MQAGKLKRAFIILLISSLLLVISGINACPQKGTAISNVGLEMGFVSNFPPASIAVGKEFQIYIDVTNKGSEHIKAGDAQFYLGGIGPQYLENTKFSLANTGTLSKESVFPERFVFSDNSKFVFPITIPLSQTLVLTSCYSYSTTASANICVSLNNASKICSIDGDKVASNTAGPIQISSVKENIAGNKLTLYIEIANKGNGEVYILNADCDKLDAKDVRESLNKQKKVNIEILSRDNFICSMQTDILPYGSQIKDVKGLAPIGSIICEKTITTEDYSAPMLIILRYKYKDSISQIITFMPSS